MSQQTKNKTKNLGYMKVEELVAEYKTTSPEDPARQKQLLYLWEEVGAKQSNMCIGKNFIDKVERRSVEADLYNVCFEKFCAVLDSYDRTQRKEGSFLSYLKQSLLNAVVLYKRETLPIVKVGKTSQYNFESGRMNPESDTAKAIRSLYGNAAEDDNGKLRLGTQTWGRLSTDDGEDGQRFSRTEIDTPELSFVDNEVFLVLPDWVRALAALHLIEGFSATAAASRVSSSYGTRMSSTWSFCKRRLPLVLRFCLGDLTEVEEETTIVPLCNIPEFCSRGFDSGDRRRLAQFLWSKEKVTTKTLGWEVSRCGDDAAVTRFWVD